MGMISLGVAPIAEAKIKRKINLRGENFVHRSALPAYSIDSREKLNRVCAEFGFDWLVDYKAEPLSPGFQQDLETVSDLPYQTEIPSSHVKFLNTSFKVLDPTSDQFTAMTPWKFSRIHQVRMPRGKGADWTPEPIYIEHLEEISFSKSWKDFSKKHLFDLRTDPGSMPLEVFTEITCIGDDENVIAKFLQSPERLRKGLNRYVSGALTGDLQKHKSAGKSFPTWAEIESLPDSEKPTFFELLVRSSMEEFGIFPTR